MNTYGLASLFVILSIAVQLASKHIKVDTNGEVASFSSGLKEPFNWIFCLIFSGAIVFYTLSFTFSEPTQITKLLYAGIVGNVVGIILVGTFEIRKLAMVTTVLASLCAVPFVLMGSQVAAMGLGFFLFCSLPAYVSLAYIRKGVNPSSLALTFMLLWVGSDLLVTIMVKIFAVVPESIGNIILVGLVALYGAGTIFIAKKYE